LNPFQSGPFQVAAMPNRGGGNFGEGKTTGKEGKGLNTRKMTFAGGEGNWTLKRAHEGGEITKGEKKWKKTGLGGGRRKVVQNHPDTMKSIVDGH